MAGFDNCVGEIVAAAGGAISRADAQGILQGLEEEHARTGDLGKAAQDMADAERMAAAIEKRNALLNRAARENRRARIEKKFADLGGKPGDLATAIKNEVVAINTPVDGGRFSAEAQWKTRHKQYIDGLVVDLKSKGLLAAVRSGEMEDAWAREMYERSMQQAGEPGQPGVTGNKMAADIADSVHRFQSLAKDNLNRSGAWIGDYAGYITRTAHDADKIRRAGFDAWSASILPKLDQARTFEGIADQGGMLRSVYDALSTGVHLSDDGPVGLKDPAFTGPGNAAKKASASRTLHFQDAQGWLGYQREFGHGTLFENVLGSLDRSARQEALMSRFGTSPLADFQQDIRHFQEKFRGSNPEAVVKLQDSAGSLDTLFSYMDGRANMPGNKLAAQISSGVRAVKSMASLGAVAFTHLSAGVTKAAELRYQGVGLGDRYGNFVSSIMQGRGSGEVRELSDLMLAGTEGMHGNILNRFSPDDTTPGTLSKVANRFFQATGLTYLLDGQKAGAQRIMARHLGMMVDRAHDALPPETQRAFRQYGISPAEWDALRTAPDHVTVDGRVHLTPDAAHRAGADSIQGAMPVRQGELPGLEGDAAARADAGARDGLALKLAAYYSDVADRSIITPGIQEKALLLGGNRPGTAVGEALRFVAQFKTWGAAAVRQGIGREVYGGQGVMGAASGVFQMAAGAAVLGYVTMTLKDLFSGKNPRQANDPKTWAAAMIQGGGFGIMGDYLFGEYSRTGGGIGETILGPVLGQGLTEVMNIYNDMKAGALGDDPKGRKIGDIGPELLRIGQSWTPFINLFYTKMAVQYGIIHQLQELMQPGYLRRNEQRLKQQTGQSYWLSPAAVHGAAGPGIAGPGAIAAGARMPQFTTR